ncbi:hypothetical protein [Rhodoferax lacus]|uniref:hypothetical protein n=1 Tax=Rhodoferax lacus TaxID=2184758 RepID=UPI001F39807C|nr:hypothetical protein [Rhodoferax lacus]
MEDDIEIVYSPLQQRYTKDGHTLDIQIYKYEDDADWTLEVVADDGLSTVWNEGFPTDKAAFEQARWAIDAEGAEAFLSVTLPRYPH